MKTANKIVLLYTIITLSIIMVSIIIFALAGWYVLIFIGICAILIYLTGKHYINRITGQINKAYQSEKDFIRNASHELNNPLTAIQGECEITLMKERTPAEYQGALIRIASETKRMVQLMKHLIFLSRGDKEMLDNAVEPMLLAEFILKEFVQGRVSFSIDNFSLIINANPQLLKMALDNIIGNACKYSKDKQVCIELRGTVLSVIDYGIGIPKEELDKIYQPFYRGSNTREFSGNGIGLSFAIRVLNFYGAKVTISSIVNKETRVTIDFQ